MAEVNPFGPVQLKVGLGAGEEPFSVTMGVLQPMVPPVAFAPGGVLFRLTVADAVEVQLLVGLVTVTVYVPAALAEGFEILEVKPFGPVHENVAVGTLEVAFSKIDVVAQVSVPPEALAVGGVVLPVTVAVAEAVQPLEALVTVTV